MECKDRALSRINRIIANIFMTTKHIEEIEMHIEEIEMYIEEIEMYIVEIEMYILELEIYIKEIEMYIAGIEIYIKEIEMCIEETPMSISMASRSSVRTVRWVVFFIKCWKSIFVNFMLVAKSSAEVVIRSAPWCVHRAGLIRYRVFVFCVKYCACDCPPCSC